MNASAIGAGLGGLGLLLLGMGLMTEGLRLAAGRALTGLLGRWTRTRPRGLFAGFLITAVVQSSSAVTVATIGFANSGLLTLEQSAWVVFGSNVGTTATGWLVATIGLKLRVEALALPFVGAGVLLRLLRPGTRLAGVGDALAGFGLLFLGLSFLQGVFEGLGTALDLSAIEGGGVTGLLAGVGIGFLLTAVMQSSSAALAIALTAAQEGVLELPLAAAIVIGANVGTTSTALLSSIGATPNARRVSALHVLFNVITAVVASVLLIPMLGGIRMLRDAAGLASSPATELALFHTSFNVLGLILMWPLAGRVVRFLELRFRTAEEDLARPKYLDDNVLPVVDVACGALLLELQRAGTRILARASRLADEHRARRHASELDALRTLLSRIGDYATRLGRAPLSHDLAERLTALVRLHQRYVTLVRLVVGAETLRTEAETLQRHAESGLSSGFRGLYREQVVWADTSLADFDLARCAQLHERLEQSRVDEKRSLIDAGMSGRLSSESMSVLIQLLGQLRRIATQSFRSAQDVQALHGEPGAAGSADPDVHEDVNGAA